MRSTRVKWGAKNGNEALGIKLPWLFFTIKELDQAFFLEIGVVCDRGAMVTLRIASWVVNKFFLFDQDVSKTMLIPTLLIY